MTTEYKIVTDITHPLYDKTYKEVLWWVKEYGHTLRYVKTQTPELCLTAIQTLPQAISFINPQFYKELGITLLAKYQKVYTIRMFYYQGKYIAGRSNLLNAKQALKYWNKNSLFTKAIIKNEIAIKYPAEEKLYFVVLLTEKNNKPVNINLIPVTYEEATLIKNKITTKKNKIVTLEEYNHC